MASSSLKTLEDKKLEAIAVLAQLGAVKYVRDLDLYHGRAREINEGDSEWKVKSNFNNAGNATGNRNVNKVSGLYVADKDIASEFAQERSYEHYKAKAEVHKIVSDDNNAIIFDSKFQSSELKGEDLDKYNNAMQVLSQFSITKGNPIAFKYRDAWDILIKEIMEQCKRTPVSDTEKNKIIANLKRNETIADIFNRNSTELSNFVHDVIGAINSRTVLDYDAVGLLRLYQEGQEKLTFANDNEQYSLNSAYISAWCGANHIVGVEQKVRSATLGKVIDICHLFDLKKIMSEKQHGEMLAQVSERYGRLASSLKRVISDKDTKQLLVNADSKELMEYVQKDQKCNQLFNKSAGIWEGWTVGQHTGAVIDFFDRYFKDKVPQELIPFIKLVLLTHDIGKGVAAEKGLNQDDANVEQSSAIFDYFNINGKFQKLIKFIISDSQIYTTAILKGNKKVQINGKSFKEACKSAFMKSMFRLPSDKEVTALMNVCVILQHCDSGAYTHYASIREDGKFVAGGNQRFTDSFKFDETNTPRLANFEDFSL